MLLLSMHSLPLFTVRELHREYARAGANVLQALNFFANESLMKELGITQSVEEVNRAACR